MGTLQLYRKMPDTMQKELAQSDHVRLRKRPKRGKNLPNSECQLKCHILDVFSAVCGRIELILFAMYQASCDTSVEYPQHIIPTTLKIHFC